MSRSFIYGQGHASRPIAAVVLVYLLASGAYAVAVWAAAAPGAFPLNRLRVALLWGLALAPRLIYLGSNPILEDDFHRYLWDGGTVLSGINPYRHSPEQVAEYAADDGTDGDRQTLARLARGSPAAARTFERINHPQVSTVYPPAAVAVFALSQWIAPWSLTGLRVVFLSFDVGTMALLWHLLARLALPRTLWIVYAWCPLVLKEIANSAHMDAIPVFLVTACLWAMIGGRPIVAAGALAWATLAKLYAVALFPLVLVWLARRGRRTLLHSLLGAGAAASGLTLLVGWPAFPGHSGFLAYAGTWRANSALYPLIESLFGERGAPIVVGAMLGGLLLWRSVRLWRSPDPREAARGFLWVLGAVFCLSPSQFPWYAIWVIPVLCFNPSAPWVLLTGLLGLYYLDFWIGYNVTSHLAHRWRHGLRLVEHAPFFLLLLGPWAFRVMRGRRAAFVSAVAAAVLLAGCSTASRGKIHETVHAPDRCPICHMYTRLRNAVVRIETSRGMGSGSLIDARRVLTNRHVVGDQESVQVSFFDGRRIEGRVVKRGEEVDLALVELAAPGAGIPPIPLGSTSEVEEGEEVYVIGHPMGLGWTVTRGIVSRIRGTDDPTLPGTIQIDAPISPGNSGGPLLTSAGRLVGVVTSKVLAPGAENLGFACPVEKVRLFLGDGLPQPAVSGPGER